MHPNLAPALAERNELLPPAIANLTQMMALEPGHQYIRKLLLQLALLGLHLDVLRQRLVGIDAVLHIIPSKEAIEIHDERLIRNQGQSLIKE